MTLHRASGRPDVVATKPSRDAYADSLKVLLVAGVIVGHVTMSWSGIHAWVLEETPLREPLLTVIKLAAVVRTMFAMAVFFLIAGAFTPASLARKGLGKFMADRTVRLGVPVVFFVVVFASLVEYVDSDNTGWSKGFPAFAVHIWRNPAPGPTWFLAVLLLLSGVYAVVRTLHPRRAPPGSKVPTSEHTVSVMVWRPVRSGCRPFGWSNARKKLTDMVDSPGL
jgi:glucan biosynthesis protein C